MVYRISLSAEDHGYEIRLEEAKYSAEVNVEERGTEITTETKTVESSTVLACLLIDTNYHVALGSFNTLNAFINACVKNHIIPEKIFRYLKH